MKMFVISHEYLALDPEEKAEMGDDADTDHHFELISFEQKYEMRVSFPPHSPEIDKLHEAFVSREPIEINVRWRDTGESLLPA